MVAKHQVCVCVCVCVCATDMKSQLLIISPALNPVDYERFECSFSCVLRVLWGFGTVVKEGRLTENLFPQISA